MGGFDHADRILMMPGPAWYGGQNSSGYYVSDVAEPLQAAARQVWPGWGYGQFSQEAIWAATVTPGLNAGKSMLPASDQFPVQVGLGELLNNVPQVNPTAGEFAVQRPRLALATLLAITPVLIVFLFSQRFPVAGLLAGATKE